ncbi:SUMF1/EgtB/PvdO family nonheme iron enzyme [Pseudoalteromonas sp. SWXJZ94C]|uniref:formylglycine-generating enzyme family protein n=1 Tax=Pseudoalteromonas sp. SWXJZ94C TaxID=2792065 RepID=UPI0018CFDB12|nr:SUMF1/EgtB/PvdO family nonheme iron enzyme [Pseudoalteromonas sp. SWXJZ94C]MBH0057580.1 SUMF1/EgtB/PvdO family nonheme iron enzyme [Pseudoalteromonas sp. SWXJZ94C]
MLSKLKIKYLAIIIILIGFSVGFFNISWSSFKLTNHEVTYIQDKLKNGELSPNMVIIPPGTGTIGGENFRSFQDEAPIFEATVKDSYALSETEITFAQYDQFCKTGIRSCPSDEGWGRGKQPVINISWFDTVAYTKWLSKETGYTYRLPSEVEWEYAARAGTSSKFWWGNEYKQGIDHCDRDLGGCPKGTDLGHPWQVGILKPNPFGLYDVTSNVYEWVEDCYVDNHNNVTGTTAANKTGDCNDRTVKGASWTMPQPHVHHSLRMGFTINARADSIGFRVLREINKDELKD